MVWLMLKGGDADANGEANGRRLPCRQIYDNEEHHKKMNKDSLMHAPEFVIKPRSHTVWENQSVRLHCTLSGWPNPHVVW